MLHDQHLPPPLSQAAQTPMRQYAKLVEAGTLRADDHQTRIIEKLQKLHDELSHYEPPKMPSLPSPPSLISRLFSRETSHSVSSTPEKIPHGLYLYGDVGTGKTMLMDLFYNTLPPFIKRKRLEARFARRDPIAPVARDLASEAYVLCFDEFQVTDIADAMILRQLFERLINLGVVCVITSNRHPDELYKNGIQRTSFIPCIELLKTRFAVTDLDSGTDYRRIPRTLSHVYYDPLTPENRAEVQKIFTALTSDPSDPVQRRRELHVWGRPIVVPESTSTIAKFRFHDLCGKPMSAADYLEITKTFGTIFVLDVPKMGLEQKDMARRFITFVDACYESKTKLIVSSEVPIYQIFADDPNKRGQVSDHMRSVMDDLGLSSDMVGSSSMFSGDEELFAFARCCSRLVQMGSKEWAETAGTL
ncbi:hypothetical protein A0H81_09842 [Grifola frondosa]|uniref:Lactation elevated protein 1 n=1 Tax=Grifola frondosa TaxID=5627 RepID=A0A1C7LZA5_GRIFR|nr:hypothetical protein A0H81_09842 [Grifola frondosa]